MAYLHLVLSSHCVLAPAIYFELCVLATRRLGGDAVGAATWRLGGDECGSVPMKNEK